ncbi:MAG: TetR/AcrR family transcriptional regulator [Pseudomonadota bacterium]
MTASTQSNDGYARRRQAFRQRILDSATVLIRERESIEFSMRELASHAEVSPATPFNHFGSKLGILSALVTQSLQHIQNTASVNHGAEPVEQLFGNLQRVTAYYAGDAKLYRPLFKAIIGEMSPKTDSLELALSMLHESLSKAKALGTIKSEVNIDLLAEQIESFWLGTLVFWIGGIVDGECWQQRVEQGLASMLTGAVADDIRLQLIERAIRTSQ